MTVATLAYSTNSHAARVLDPIARVRAAGRVAAERKAREARVDRAWDVAHATGQLCLDEQDWCYVCGRPTDHTGEHTPEQIAAWREGRA
jgi:hypothetical protein